MLVRKSLERKLRLICFNFKRLFKWHHTICNLLEFGFFPWDSSKLLHIIASSVPWYGCTTVFNYSCVGEHLSCFQLGAVMNKAAFIAGFCMNVSFYFSDINLPSVQLLDCMVIACFIRSCQIVSQSGCTILHSYQQYVSDPVSTHPCQHLVLLSFILAILISV